MYPDVKILSSDGQGITFEFRPRFLPDEKIIEGDVEYAQPHFEYGYKAINTEPGKENIFSRVIGVGLPGFEENTISIIASDYETINNFSLAPIPEIISIDKYGSITKRYKDRFTTQGFTPQSIASLENISQVKGLIVGNITISPFQFQSSTKTLRKYSRIVVRVEYGKKEKKMSDSNNDEWAKASLLNYDLTKLWAKQLAFKKTTATNSVLEKGNWYKVEVVEDGMYKIDAAYLQTLGVDLSSISMSDIKIFGSDGKKLPENITTTRPLDLPQVAVSYIDGNNNNKFDDGDYVLFYGQGVTGWNYNIFTKEYGHYTNCYTNSNYYFIGIGSNAPLTIISTREITGSSAVPIISAIGKVFFDEEKINFNQSGQNWVSAPFNPSESRTISNKLNGWVAGISLLYKYQIYSRANVSSTFVFEESGIQIGSRGVSRMDESVLDSPQADYAIEDSGRLNATPVLSDERSNLKITYKANSNVATGYIDWVEVFYRQKLTAVNDHLLFHSPDTSGIVEYQLNGFSNNDISVFDVSITKDVKKIHSKIDQVFGTVIFTDSMASGSVKRYWVGIPSSYKLPKSFAKLPNSNIHGNLGAEFIIITSNEFKSEATRLRDYKESMPKPISTVVVDIDTIFNEFGIGMPDPVAIRDFLKFAQQNWSVTPGYVLFFGDASYDFKSILGNDKSWVPAFQTTESNHKIYSYSYEDFFAYLYSQSVSIAHGRLCPRSLSEAALLVDRIIDYETKANLGEWKNTLTIVGDDVWTPENQSEETHTKDAEILASLPSLKAYEIKKIYIGEYQTVFTSSGRRKPEARLAIINQVNNGTLVINYTGHGNPKVWAHESILTLDDVKTQFTNKDKLTFFVGATCDWGRFEEAGEQSSAEEAMVNVNGGAIGVLSATRSVFSDGNSKLNLEFYHQLFDPVNPLPLGDVLMLTKNELGTDTNTQKYFLLGDPTLTLAIPKLHLTIDSINQKSTEFIDTLQALEKVTVKASVKDTNGAIINTINGTALVTIYDSDRSHKFKEMSGDYKENGSIIYNGVSTISNGIFSASFIVPKDITYETKSGRMSVYFSNSSTDGRGYTTNFVVGGTNNNAGSDSLGPALRIYFDKSSFQSGDVVNEHPTLIIDLKDSNGINSSGSAIGHRIEAWIDGNSRSIDMTNFYKGKIDSYQEGTVEYKLSDISIGRHSIKVRAWDVYNNSSTDEVDFVVMSDDGLSLVNVYNFPNPVSSSTVFTFQYNQLSPIDVSIKLYSVAGRLIHTIDRYGVSDRFVNIPWDRTDKDGDIVGNGIYFYKIVAKTIDGKYTSEALGKLAVVR